MDRRPLILVADDSEDIRNLFGIMLKTKYEVRYLFVDDGSSDACGTPALAVAPSAFTCAN